uniref:ARAD1C42570p n=1 Tax=Blastobotrys adeninivorans TaxID=409370 RepID=A0A060T4P1_BLAAD
MQLALEIIAAALLASPAAAVVSNSTLASVPSSAAAAVGNGSTVTVSGSVAPSTVHVTDPPVTLTQTVIECCLGVCSSTTTCPVLTTPVVTITKCGDNGCVPVQTVCKLCSISSSVSTYTRTEGTSVITVESPCATFVEPTGCSGPDCNAPAPAATGCSGDECSLAAPAGSAGNGGGSPAGPAATGCTGAECPKAPAGSAGTGAPAGCTGAECSNAPAGPAGSGGGSPAATGCSGAECSSAPAGSASSPALAAESSSPSQIAAGGATTLKAATGVLALALGVLSLF